ncbi:uncharacterized protein LOC125757601 [Rhipicephalus sanguineus]|uniref:uncharacterized protein LOC125757601 n=1 Tax=Rhipicephalus sanguineus TaxID=34632 RepID=UPI0020C3E848|nr:uncharacterized protein LOC125757601 [Rhipicephalus sanguineus]
MRDARNNRATGCLQRHYRMVLREGALPVVQTARRVPLVLREPLRKELDRMEREGIIIKVTEPTEWDLSFGMRTGTCRDPPGSPAADAATRLPVWSFPPSRQT